MKLHLHKLEYSTAPSNNDPNPYNAVLGTRLVKYQNGMFLYVDPTKGQTNEGAAPIQIVTLGTSPETGTVDVGV